MTNDSSVSKLLRTEQTEAGPHGILWKGNWFIVLLGIIVYRIFPPILFIYLLDLYFVHLATPDQIYLKISQLQPNTINIYNYYTVGQAAITIIDLNLDIMDTLTGWAVPFPGLPHPEKCAWGHSKTFSWWSLLIIVIKHKLIVSNSYISKRRECSSIWNHSEKWVYKRRGTGSWASASIN